MQSSRNLNDSIVVYMTTLFDGELAASAPPETGTSDNEHIQQLMLDNAKSSAQYYDAYQLLVQMSFLDMRTDAVQHYMMCSEAAPSIDGNIVMLCSEANLIAAMHQHIINNYAALKAADRVIVPVNFAGWKINTFWPYLINKLFRHGYSLPACYCSSPTRRFLCVDHLYDVSSIYTQGLNNYARRLPTLRDTLIYWGIAGQYASQDEIEKSICCEPKKAARSIEQYLFGLREAMRHYNTEDQQ